MRVGIYTTDLFYGREFLMPWRTVIEIGKRLTYKGYDVYLINAGNENVEIDGINIITIKKGYKILISLVEKLHLDILFMEMKWREAFKCLKGFEMLSCKKIAYFTGGIYDFRSILTLGRYAKLREVKPYFLELVSPPPILGKKLKNAGFSCIGLTEVTTKVCIRSAKINTVCIYPGKDEFDKLVSDMSMVEKYGLIGKKFLCFTGAPASTRGAEMLLTAIKRLRNRDITFVFLMRKDVGSDFAKIESLVAHLPREKVVIVDKRLTREQLKGFFESAWYMILPFIVVPSEIPLTYFEIMQCGIPVISFNNGGTSEYLQDAMLIAPKSVNGLVNTIDFAWNNMDVREKKSQAAIHLMNNHPTWDECTNEWEKFIIQ